MKKFFTIAAALLLCVCASAQKVGIVGGFTSSELKLKDIKKSSVAQYHIGIAYNQPIALGFSVQPELIYNVKGTSFDELKGLADFKATMGYVEVPVQIQWGVDLLVAQPYIFAEPYVGYAVNGKWEVNDTLGIDPSGSVDMSDLDSRWEYGFAIGFGVNAFKRVQLSFKYFWNFEDGEIGNYMDQLKDKISEKKGFTGLAISAGIFF
jgi:hypothetical protein